MGHHTQSGGGRLAGLLDRFAAQRILVIGDLMLDEFIWGRVSRISPEAPVPVVNVTGESYYPGGAANVARNVREYTASIAVMGRVGGDRYGERLAGLLAEAGIDTSAMQRDPGMATIVKTRIIARNQQVVRVDREQKSPMSTSQTGRAREDFDRAIEAADAIVVADYAKGFVTQELADHISRAARERGKILAVDPHPHTSIHWNGATVIKPNRAEAFLAVGLAAAADAATPIAEDPALIEVGNRLRSMWRAENLLITLGEHGMLLWQAEGSPYHIPTRAKDVFDVSGAGDTAIAVLALTLAAGGTAREAAELANYASGIAVGKLGTATVTAGELHAAVIGL